MVSQILLYISDVRDNKFVDSQCHILITFEAVISFATDFLGFTTILLGQIKIYTTLYSVAMVKDNIHVCHTCTMLSSHLSWISKAWLLQVALI